MLRLWLEYVLLALLLTMPILNDKPIYSYKPEYLLISNISSSDISIFISDNDQGHFKCPSISSIKRVFPKHTVVNGTFFDIYSSNQPLGCIISNNSLWIPTTQIFDGTYARDLDRYYFAIDDKGNAKIGQGNSDVIRVLYNKGYKCLIGGCGILIKDGVNVLSYKTLSESKFRDSVIRRASNTFRTIIGIDHNNKVAVFVSTTGITLDYAVKLLLNEKIKDAVFLDGGGSSGFFIDQEHKQIPRIQPTYILIKS